ncbi:PadR family transcriptional regulator [Aquibacillus rhizosphaerae]|uniref:PadR family transcriptional regulator n=1 Tax=Aquibacillus rhizosphaerae TaxID=3051431 RepID=A0ABT7L0W3_9BACI|nr:PadR family transcriptional regulator [Aquibacillus sp. LR5S19]MDL4839428.1 PadR family transcriptional regulator [Aquibacillus sp. LR5S19]
MKNYNHTTYAILGILTTECKSGYAIKKFIDNSLNHFWKISYGQIYPTLKSLVQEGLADVYTSSSEGKQDKNEYHLTEKGIDTLKEWLGQPVEQLPIERNEILLKLFFSRFQSYDQTALLLNQYKQRLESRHQTYLAIEQSIVYHNKDDEDAMYWLFTLDYGKSVTISAIEWCKRTLGKLQKKED